MVGLKGSSLLTRDRAAGVCAGASKYFLMVRRKIENVGSPWWAEVFLLYLEAASAIVFHFRMVAAEPVISHSFRAGMEVRNGNTGIVAAPSADDLSAGERVHPPEAGAAGKARINPTHLQCAEVGGSEVVADAVQPIKTEWGDQRHCTVPGPHMLVVDIAVARIHLSPPASRTVQTSNRLGNGCCTQTVSEVSTEFRKVKGGGGARRRV